MACSAKVLVEMKLPAVAGHAPLLKVPPEISMLFFLHLSLKTKLCWILLQGTSWGPCLVQSWSTGSPEAPGSLCEYYVTRIRIQQLVAGGVAGREGTGQEESAQPVRRLPPLSPHAGEGWTATLAKMDMQDWDKTQEKRWQTAVAWFGAGVKGAMSGLSGTRVRIMWTVKRGQRPGTIRH
ncbi:Hypothetical protein TPAR_09586 [Tolypocladium paradoxum]|uniref:Uncharacterized protein n=1 Tax=Tolypocladium paradoxum TaxID=94208 RepID=A0A2S4KNY7_9HYPO|nr:Hypothetical protein TPAR_09586 [Tolypocladium paradoxum]